MNDPIDDRELEAMLSELSSSPEERLTLLEEHRQLEKDLLRLADPLPPADFVAQVMKKVASSPPPAPAKADIALASLITFGAFAAGVVMFFSHGTIDGAGVSFASMLVHVRELFLGFGGMLEAVWRTSAMPLSIGLAGTLLMSLVALKRLGTEAKVSS